MKKHKLLLIIISIFVLLLLPSGKNHDPQPKPISAKNGMVVCSERNASEVGLKILQKGGNAMDAAIAMSFALAVTHPGAGNLGGGGFIVYYSKDGKITSIDFREKAPLHASAAMFLDKEGNILNNANHHGLLSVGVPGTVAGLEMAHKKYGKMDWKDLLEPAIHLAEDGFYLSEGQAHNFKSVRDRFLEYPSSATVFMKKDRSSYAAGELWRQPDLAETLKRIEKYGKEDFYNGETARLLCDFMQKNGGIITSEDLKKYKAVEREPLHCNYRGYDVYSMGPPSSGGAVITEMLNILEGYNLAGLAHDSVQYMHILSETMRLAYLDRARYLGDMDFNPDIPLKMLCSKEYASKVRNLIQTDKALHSELKDAELVTEGAHTTHLSVIDSEGNAVSLTYTIEDWYGSKIIVEGAGFLLNNEMGDFNPVPGKTNEKGIIGTKPNLIAPEKRMLSSMCPVIVLKNKQPFLIIGTPGGRTIPNGVLQVVLNVIDFKMNISDAISRKRIHHQWMPDVTFIEDGVLSANSLKTYEKMGHKTDANNGIKNQEAMGILVDKKNNLIYGAADPRSGDGMAMGY